MGHGGSIYTTETTQRLQIRVPPMFFPENWFTRAPQEHDTSSWAGVEPTPSLAAVISCHSPIWGSAISQPCTFLSPGQDRGGLDEEQELNWVILYPSGACLASACLSTGWPSALD